MQDLLNLIAETHRRRKAWQRASIALTLQSMSVCRRLCLPTYDPNAGEKAQEVRLKVAKEDGAKLYEAVLKGKPHKLLMEAEISIRPLILARENIDTAGAGVDKVLAKMVKDLPVIGWVNGVRGVAELSLAGIVGEAGDLNAYANPGKLWKRFGLAVYDGKAQRRSSDKEAATEMGFSPIRRSLLWNVGQLIIRAQIRKPDGWKAGDPDDGTRTALGPLGKIYLERKAYETQRDPDMPKAHAHNRAQRYMEKRFLRELWVAWRKAAGVHSSEGDYELQKAA